jgi:hypothetical protein
MFCATLRWFIQVEFLMNDADAVFLRRMRAVDVDFFAIEQDLAGVLLIDPRQDLHERRLARAILTHERVNLAGKKLNPNVVQRPHAGEGLRDALD